MCSPPNQGDVPALYIVLLSLVLFCPFPTYVLAFDLTIEGQVKAQTIIPKGPTVVLRG